MNRLYLALGAILAMALAQGAHAQQSVQEKVDNKKQCKKLRKYARKGQIPKIEKFFVENPNFALDCVTASKLGGTPLFFAVAYYQPDTVKYLIENGANPNHELNNGGTPLIELASFPPKNTANEAVANEILQILVEAGANINHETPSERTPLVRAVQEMNYTLIKPMIDLGADANFVDDRGSNLHDIALYQKRRSGEYSLNWWPDNELKVFDEYGIKPSVPFFIDEPEFPKYNWAGYSEYSAYYQTSEGKSEQIRIKKSVAQKRPSTYQCEDPELINLTPDEGVAMKYAVAQDLREKGVDFGKQCIAKITATSKVPFRGNTLVKYDVRLFFPFGYKAECLKLDKNAANNLSKKWDWNTYEKITAGGCNAFSGAISGEPIEVGGYRKFEGETEI